MSDAAGATTVMDPLLIPAGEGLDAVTDGPARSPVEDTVSFDNIPGSDVSMSGISDGESEGTGCSARSAELGKSTLPGPQPADHRSHTAVENTKKRKSPGVVSEPSDLEEPNLKAARNSDEPMKHGSKPYLPSDRSLLPAEIWHHIFTLVPPKTLGRVLQVNRKFNTYLNHHGSPPQRRNTPPIRRAAVSDLQPEAIWQSSRRRYWPKMPAPLVAKTELDMWRLICSRRCHYCGRPSLKDSVEAQGKLGPGPGVDGVKTIWPFSVVSCGPCLLTNSTKELDLLLSTSIPSLLLPALQFVLITDDMQVFSPGTLEHGQVPKDMLLAKIFLSTHIVALKEEFLGVKNLGLGAAEEWVKGLEGRGKRDRLDASRWEKWETAGGVAQMMGTGNKNASDDMKAESESSLGNLPASTYPVTKAGVDQHRPYSTTDASTSTTSKSDSQPALLLTVGSNEPSSRSPPSLQASSQPPQLPRTRTREEALEMKAARRAEIERRVMLLEPSLAPNVLAHIPAFQAALQITTPLDDTAWELLKPRLLAQRADAEKREDQEQELTAHSPAARDHSEGYHMPEGLTRESKELLDKDWDDAQAPLRAEISMYADETLHNNWDNGSEVNKENAPRFAAEVLLCVRQRFYTEVSRAALETSAAGREPIRDPPQGPFTQKLTLENMKWLFDTKIKPHTESYHKELFLCNGCEDNLKAYGFEGVVQHYAAKHTNSLSLGSIVVYWRSEWPEIPPFHPDPVTKVSKSKTSSSAPLNRAGHTTSHLQGRHPLLPPGEGVPLSAYSEPPYFSQHAMPGILALHGGLGYPPGTHPGSRAAYSSAYPQQGVPYSVAYGPPISTLVSLPAAPPATPFDYHSQFESSGSIPPAMAYHGRGYNIHQANSPGGYPSHGSYPDKVYAQLEDLAYNSRELWMATAGVKALPGNIRLYIVLHHLAKRYRSRFLESPPLKMFIDGLSNNKEMRPVRNVNRLKCRACYVGPRNLGRVQGERSTFSFPQLVNHFQQKHIEPLQAMGVPLSDWTTDMVYVAGLPSLSDLRAMAGMDNYKYTLIIEAFSQAAITFGLGSEEDTAQRKTSVAHISDPDATAPGNGESSSDPSLLGAPTTAKHIFDDNNQMRTTGEIYPLEGGGRWHRAHRSHRDGVPLADMGRSSRNTSHNWGCLDSGRNSPDTRLSLSAKHHRKRKVAPKEQRVTPGKAGKSRKVNSKNTTGVLSGTAVTAEDERDNEAEEEALRQEEAIRAMWAAERRAAARLASAPATPQLGESADGIQHANATPDIRALGRTNSRGGSTAGHRSSSQQSSSSPVSSEEDLFAGLESHLEEQRALSLLGSYHAELLSAEKAKATDIEPRSAAVAAKHADSDRRPLHVARAAAYERARSQSPPREEHGEVQVCSGDTYRERSPVVRYAAPGQAKPRGPLDSTEPAYFGRPPYAQGPRQDPYRVHAGSDGGNERPRPGPNSGCQGDPYASEVRRRPTLSHGAITETYELVLVRDLHGEYYIRRPIRREPEVLYSRYDGERALYRDAIAYQVYEGDGGYLPLVYEPVVRMEGTAGAHEDVSNQNVAACEEYDPRYPAAPSSLGSSRHARYP